MSEDRDIEDLINDLEDKAEEYEKEREKAAEERHAERQAAWEDLWEMWSGKRALLSFVEPAIVFIGLVGFATPPFGTPVAVLAALGFIVFRTWKQKNQ